MAPWTRMFSFPSRRTAGVSERSRRQVNQEGWDSYARSWDVARNQGQIPDLRSDHAAHAQHLGDEWSLMEGTEFPYGVDARSVQSFAEYIEQRMLVPYLPPRRDLTILEIGPGGGRITALLLPRARRLYAVDVSAAMLQRLQQRFDGDPRIAPLLTDGTNIAGIPAASLDAAVSFDAFVHFEPWEIFQYLEIVRALLREGGLGIVHFSDIETSIGFELFRSQVPAVVRRGVDFGTFSVMSKSIMARFLNELGFEIVVITNDVVPRDAVAVFCRKRSSAESSG
jgi:SAM-dependent methyltransferase